MLFHSTRGKDNNKTFEDVLMQGLAEDGGLFVPNYWPEVDINVLRTSENFIDVAKHIVPLFTDSSYDKNEVEEILDRTWHDFEKKRLHKYFQHKRFDINT